MSGKTARAREASIQETNSYYGQLDIDCFADNSRTSTPFQSEMQYWEPEDQVSGYVKNLQELPSIYQKEILPRWVDQPHYVEIWTEKAAMVGKFQQLLGDRQIAIVPFGGFHSVSYLWENAKILKYFQSLGKQIHILYFGDFDPTGMVIEETMKNKLFFYGVDDVDWQRIGVTYEQMVEFNLPKKVDAKTYKKLENHQRVEEFKNKYGGLYQIEIDALPALIPEEFRNMVIYSVDKYFDEDIYNSVLEKYSEEYVKEIVDSKIKILDDED